MKLTTMLIGLAVMMFALVSCGQPSVGVSGQRSALEQILAAGKLRVGYIVYPPIVTKDPNSGELGGHFVWSLEQIAKEASWNLEFVETDWATFSAGLNSGKFDVSIAPTFTTIPRLKSVAFTKPLLFAGNSAIARLDFKGPNKIIAFNEPGFTIAVTQGEAGHEYALEYLPNAKLIVHTGSDQSLAFQDVIVGRADIALGDAYATREFAARYSDKVKDLFIDEPYNLTPVSWAVRHNELALLQFLNSAIDVLDTRGLLKQYEQKAGANWLHVEKKWVHY